MIAENYIKLSFDLPQEKFGPMVAVLSGIGFYAFEEKPAELDAYILPKDYNEAELNRTLDQYFPDFFCKRQMEQIESRDWNSEWEKNFKRVKVRDFCQVRPPFRKSKKGFAHEVIVAPKMAFGTGHHATTWLMIDQLSRLDVTGKSLLDMGCGTGVLGILARKLNASSVTCIDIDEWSEVNARENAQLNDIEDLEVIRGDADSIPGHCYDIILANINRNVLLADRDKYIAHLQVGGTLVLSGIYDFDAEKLIDHYLESGLRQVDRREKNEWVLVAFQKEKKEKL